MQGTQQYPSRADLHNDLAAAYLERFRRRGARDDAVRAGAAAMRATELSPGRPEPWFNLALSRQTEGNERAALQAVERAETVDPASPWTAELRSRLDGFRER